ncbi:hypothetical protein DFH06DRAFT_1054424 [Mycena polygramma]|nr:hypothetical protein DFH06DRAFT_1054424 [Mycena polygramma]
MDLKSVDELCAILESDLTQHVGDIPAAEEWPEAGDIGSELVHAQAILLHAQHALSQACDLIRKISLEQPESYDIIERVNRTINLGVRLVPRRHFFYEFPSFAHSAESPLVERAEGVDAFSRPQMADQYGIHRKRDEASGHDPWFTTPRPHELSSELARFNWELPSPSYPSLLANAVVQARCAIDSHRSGLPTSIAISESCLMVPYKTGWRDREPGLAYYRLDETPNNIKDPEFLFTGTRSPIDFNGTFDDDWHADIDEVNKLMFVADDRVVKSYAWADSQSGEIYDFSRLTHTLDTHDHRGPICVFAPGSFLRAGTGSVAFWNLHGLETCGPEEGLASSDPDEERHYAGSPPTTAIKLADSKFSPYTWHVHPNLPGTMLCAPTLETYPATREKDYALISLDLDSAKTAARFLGHAGSIEVLSTDKTEPHVFLTASTDGFVRLYDTRFPLPALSYSANQCIAAVLVYPDGIPMAFTGSSSEQVVRLFDIRASKFVYDLATGNNEVEGMAWDAHRNVLYVSTFNTNVDKNCQHDGYRPAKHPELDAAEDDSMGDDDYDLDEDGDFLFAWPITAAHTEDYFGYVFDAGEHRIFRYAFDDQADPNRLPIYGTAPVDRDY